MNGNGIRAIGMVVNMRLILVEKTIIRLNAARCIKRLRCNTHAPAGGAGKFNVRVIELVHAPGGEKGDGMVVTKVG